MKEKICRTLRISGLIGLLVQTTINLVVRAMGKIEFFSERWWSDFFPGYLVWFVFAVIGFVGSKGKSDANQK